MACVVPSRFAKLKIVEDDFVAAKMKELKLQTRKEAESPKLSKIEIPETKKAKSKVIKSQSKAPPAAAAGGTGVPGGAPGGAQGDSGWQVKKKRRVPPPNAQWEDWKQRDSQLVDGHFQEDMQQALLLSKIEFEAQKKDKVQGSKKPKKVKNVPAAQSTQRDHLPDPSDQIEIDEKEGPPPEQRLVARERVEPPENVHTKREPPSNDEIKGSQLRSLLDVKEEELRALREEVETLKAELLKVKTRNKKLCNIIGQGEMKDKAQVLVETENLREVQAELNAEVATLNATLQQERSRCSCANRQDKKKRPPANEKEN